MGALQHNKKALFAIIIIFIGTVLLLDNLRVFDLYIPYYFSEWYAFLIYIGLFLLLGQDKRGPGITLIVLGALFMASDYFNIHFFDLWPVILIVIGVSILTRKKISHSFQMHSGENRLDIIDVFSVFSGAKQLVDSVVFKGGKITTIFGGAEIDLRKASLAEGTQTIEIFSLFGGSSIIVPQDWKVTVNITPIFGGYSDERLKMSSVEIADRELVITGLVLFGGGEVKSV
ncbi:MAG: cell wall-active antibiotics response protein [Cyclobacteriaceae bacterium]|nr:cell wall-active antibiotics response protein [Cyclobacteriaceae bacterium]